MKTIGVVANFLKPDARRVVRRLVRAARGMGAALLTCDAPSGIAGIRRVPCEEMARRVELLIAMGGDGTMLRAVRTLAGHDVPVLGVNIGSLGFMTSVPEDRLEAAMTALRKGRYSVSSRTLAACRVTRGRKVIGRHAALNDIAIGWGTSSRVVTLGVSIDGEEVTSYVCDGLVVSTPTGSTGHSLSAGGPIVHPGTPAFVLSPICPHTLSNRPLVIPDGSAIGIEVLESSKQLYLAADGQCQTELREGDRVDVRKSEHTAHLVQLPGSSYYSLLRQKLHWRGSAL